ncbi:IS256 family transposase, partial [Streptomyces sp. NPDC059083]
IAIKAFNIDYGARYPKAVAKIVDDADVLLELCCWVAWCFVLVAEERPLPMLLRAKRIPAL